MEMNVKRLLAAVCVMVIGLAAAGAVKADDDFTGAYIGGYVGGTFGRSFAQTTTIFSPTGYFASSSVPAIATTGVQNLSFNGFNGGGQAGYSYQAGHVVVGFEADYGSMRLTGTGTGTATYPCCSPTAFTITQTVKSNWLVTIRPRVGVTYHRALLYITGGIAITTLNYSEQFTDTFATANESAAVARTIKGWTGGGGLEIHITKHISVKGEYLYADFGNVSAVSTNLTAPSTTAWPQNVFFHTADLRTHIVRGGINWRF
jgi:outer membrane immunogenic protein